MSIRIPTANIPAILTVTDGPNRQLHRSERKTKRTVAVMALAAAALAANLADAAASNHHRYTHVSAPKRSWVGIYAPSGYYDGGYSRSDTDCVRPDGDGYPDTLVYSRRHPC